MTVVGRRVYPVDRVYPVAVARVDKDQGVPGTGHPAPSRFAFAVGRLGAAVVVSLRGELTGSAVAQLADVLDDLICGQGNLTVVVDLREVSGVDPTALVVFSAAACWASRRGGTFRLERPSPSVRSALAAAQETVTEETVTEETEVIELDGDRR